MNSKLLANSKYREDIILWLSVLGVTSIVVILLSLFTTSSSWYFIQRAFGAIVIMFLPGYVIVKLFFDHVQFTENRIIDKAIMSLGLSIVAVQLISFIINYVMMYGLNVDQERRIIYRKWIPLIVVGIVIASSILIKLYGNKFKAAWEKLTLYRKKP